MVLFNAFFPLGNKELGPVGFIKQFIYLDLDFYLESYYLPIVTLLLTFRLRDNVEELRHSLQPKESVIEALQQSLLEKDQVGGFLFIIEEALIEFCKQ